MNTGMTHASFYNCEIQIYSTRNSMDDGHWSLLNVENLNNYISVLQDQNKFAATAIANKLRRMQQAIQYTMVMKIKQKENL